MFQQLQEKSGYISIETIIVGGLLIAVGAFAIDKFYGIGEEQTNNAMANINKVMINTTSTP